MSEAELAEVRAEDGVVLEVGKHVGKRGSETAAGEFIGLMKVSEVGAARLLQVWDEVRETVGDDEPFGHAKLFRKAYLTDLIEEMIRRGDRVDAVMIDGGWREIDTVEDLERASEDLFCERPAVWR
jgi:choline kinase